MSPSDSHDEHVRRPETALIGTVIDEESVRTLVETGVLAGERGAYRLTRVTATLQVPATAQAIVAARIDRLSTEEKRLLQAASIIRREVPFMLPEAIVPGDAEMMRRGLANLRAVEFLYETKLFPDLEYTFKHALTQEVAYKSLLQEIRRTYHGQIARALEASSPERLDEKLELIAHHYQHSGNAEKTLAYLTRAAEKAVARFTADEGSGPEWLLQKGSEDVRLVVHGLTFVAPKG